MFYNAKFSQRMVKIKLSKDQSLIKPNGTKVEYILDEAIFHKFYAIIFLALKKQIGEALKAVYLEDGEAKFVYKENLSNSIDLSGLTKAYYSCCCGCTFEKIYKEMTGESYTPEVDKKNEFISRILQDFGKFINI